MELIHCSRGQYIEGCVWGEEGILLMPGAGGRERLQGRTCPFLSYGKLASLPFESCTIRARMGIAA